MWQAPALPRTLAASLRDLDEASPEVRVSALVDLVRHHDASPAEVMRGLLRLTSDDAPQVRAAALELIGDLRAPSGLAAALAGMDDDDAYVRQMATGALRGFDDDGARQRLREALDDERPEMRFQAVIAFAHAVPSEAAAALAKAMRDDDKGIRYIALRVAEEVLVDRGAPVATAIADGARRALTDEAVEVRLAGALLLAASGSKEGAKVLVAVVDDRLAATDPDDEAAAVEAVGKLGLVEAEAALKSRAYGVSRVFRDRYAFLARTSLAQLGNERAQRDILKDLDAFNLQKRTLAVIAAGRARLDAARPVLEAMRKNPGRIDGSVVEEALAAWNA